MGLAYIVIPPSSENKAAAAELDYVIFMENGFVDEVSVNENAGFRADIGNSPSAV